MKRFNSLLCSIPFVALISVNTTSCSSEKKSAESVSETVISVSDEELVLVEMGVQQLADWVQFWKSNASTFNPSLFTLERVENFEELEWPEENPIGPNSPLFSYLLPQPEGEGTVDIYSYKVFIPTEGKPGFNPDSEVIYYKGNGLRERLLFIGPSGGFEDAIWVSPDHLMVAGFFEEEQGTTPKIWLIDTELKQYSVFKHPLYTTNYAKDGYLRKKLSNIDF